VNGFLKEDVTVDLDTPEGTDPGDVLDTPGAADPRDDLGTAAAGAGSPTA
jgi:hypothetical protein